LGRAEEFASFGLEYRGKLLTPPRRPGPGGDENRLRTDDVNQLLPRVGRAGGSSAARAKKQLQRDIDFVKEFIDAARDLEGILLNSLRRFDAAIDGHTPRMEAAP